jgi:glycosyltransferase involved in cell wall biosynthesis
MFWGLPLAGKVASGFVSTVAKDADIVVCPSAHYRDVVMPRMGLTCKAEVWEAPVDLPKPCAPDEFPAIDGLFDPEYEYLLYSGRLVEEKNLEFLFEVFRHLAKKNPFVKLVLAGGGKVEKYKNVCRKICGASSKRVIFTGHLKRDQLAYLIGGTSMGVTSSVTETQGVAVLEQLGLGTPIAVMEGTYLAEVVTTSGSGLALPPDPKVWAQSISRALTDEMWRFEAGNNGRLYIEMCFNRMVRREALLELYATGAG